MAHDRRCEHCRSRALHVACVTCQRSMCEDCISFGNAGKVCGLCKDREEGWARYNHLLSQNRTLPPFDDWYDVNA